VLKNYTVCIDLSFTLFRRFWKLLFQEDKRRYVVADIILNKYMHYQVTRYLCCNLWNVNGPEDKIWCNLSNWKATVVRWQFLKHERLTPLLCSITWYNLSYFKTSWNLASWYIICFHVQHITMLLISSVIAVIRCPWTGLAPCCYMSWILLLWINFSFIKFVSGACSLSKPINLYLANSALAILPWIRRRRRRRRSSSSSSSSNNGGGSSSSSSSSSLPLG